MLKPGQVVEFAGELHRVVLVNESRAVLRPLRRRVRAFETVSGPVRIRARAPLVSVSAKSELVPIET